MGRYRAGNLRVGYNRYVRSRIPTDARNGRRGINDNVILIPKVIAFW